MKCSFFRKGIMRPEVRSIGQMLIEVVRRCVIEKDQTTFDRFVGMIDLLEKLVVGGLIPPRDCVILVEDMHVINGLAKYPLTALGEKEKDLREKLLALEKLMLRISESVFQKE